MTLLQRNPIRRQDVSDIPHHPRRRMTEQEFVNWCTDFWAEWVDGEVILMSPVNLNHADVFSFLSVLIGAFVSKHELGSLLAELFQIRLARQRRRRSPDLFFVSNEHKDCLRYSHLEGAPDLIIEIVSPDS